MAIGKILCRHCGAPLAPGRPFCESCATPVYPPCPECQAILIENGDYCHACGVRLEEPACFEMLDIPPAAWCSRCSHPHPLSARHRFCPLTGEPIHLYVEISKLPFYRQDVQFRVQIRVFSVYDNEIRLREFRVYEGNTTQQLEDGKHRIDPAFALRSTSEPVTAGKMFYPRKPRPKRGITGCPPGYNILSFVLEYETDGLLYQLVGNENISILPKKVTQNILHNHFGDTVTLNAEAGAVVSGGATYKPITVNISGLDTTEKIEDLIRDAESRVGKVYEPLHLYVKRTETLTPAPDWEPADKARIWFTHEGIMHNYCLLSQESLLFGRNKSANVVLYEVERCWPKMQAQIKAGVPKDERKSQSEVSRIQWRVEPAPNGVRVTHLSKTAWASLGGGKFLKHNESRLLELGGQIILPNVIGLKYAANTAAIAGLDAARENARSALARMKKRAPKRDDWAGEFGGYRLERLYSLTGAPIGDDRDLESFDTAEYYLLIPGWAIIGSASDACIHVPKPGVAGRHAALIFVDGYYFILPLDPAHPISVDHQEIPHRVPWTLKPGSKIRLGHTAEITFDLFHQMYLE